MPQVAQLFFKTAIVWLTVGIALGLHMGISGDHVAFTAHAHINLLGWVTSAVFGGYYALNPAKAQRKLARIHYGVYTLGLLVMLPALYLKYGANMASIEPVLAGGSLIVAAGVLMFAVMVFARETERAALPRGSVAAR
jgi:peptidoglycan/LPS O-acetylase OafA/YrhL